MMKKQHPHSLPYNCAVTRDIDCYSQFFRLKNTAGLYYTEGKYVVDIYGVIGVGDGAI